MCLLSKANRCKMFEINNANPNLMRELQIISLVIMKHVH